MKYLIILQLISLSVVLACHSSCNCDPGSNVCKSCKFANIGAQIDFHQRSCPCPVGWYSDVTVTVNMPQDQGSAHCDYEETTGTFHEDNQQAKAVCIAIPGCKAFVTGDGKYFLSDTDVPNHGYGEHPIWIQKNCYFPQQLTTTTFSLECKRLLTTDNQGYERAQEMDVCKLEIGLKTKDMKILTDCHFENIEGKSYVISNVKLDVVNANLNIVCLNAIRTKLQYKSPSNAEQIDLPNKYIIEHPAGHKTIKIPLIDIFDIATSQSVNNYQIIQVMNLKMLIGHEDSWVRSHKWDLIVYTNRDQVEVFQIDVDIQQTEGFQPGQECIVIADLDIVSDVYTDGTYANVYIPPIKYVVGDIFYAKIRFADPTYTKRLNFSKLYFKTDQNKIFNFSSITTYSWDGTGLRIALPLVQPSQEAVIQVNMKISTVYSRFLVGIQEEQTVQSKIIASVYNKQGVFEVPYIANASNYNQQSKANILLGMSILSILFLFF